MKVIIMLRRFEIDSSLFYPKTVMQFPTLSLGSLKGDKKRSKLGVRGWVGYNLPKYLLSKRRNLVMNDFYCELDIEASSYQKLFKSIYTQFGQRGMSFEKKMFWFYNHKIKKMTTKWFRQYNFESGLKQANIWRYILQITCPFYVI